MNKMSINDVIAILLAVSGIILIFVAVFIAPMGVISESVLVALGQILALVGGLCGVSTHYSTKLKNLEKKIDNKDEDNV